MIGVAAVTRAALPALRAARGRIVNVGSIGGAVPIPFMGPYAASKGAVRALSSSMRRELAPLGVHVALLEPGAIATPIWDKGLDAADDQLAALTPEHRQLYGRRLTGLEHTTRKTVQRAASAEAAAAAAIVSLLTDRRPRAHVVLGRDARISMLAQALLPTAVFDRLVIREAGGA